MWFNMREEPVIYINGNPYVVREANKPFANLEYTGLVCKPLLYVPVYVGCSMHAVCSTEESRLFTLRLWLVLTCHLGCRY